MLSLFFILLSLCRADVAFVEFTEGDLSGSIRFEQEDGSSEVTIISNVLDTSDSHGASIAWTVYSGVSTCEDKGSQLLDLTSLLDSELRIGYASYTTDQFQVRDLFSTTLVVGLDVGCAEILEIPEALRVYSTISWGAAVGDDVIEQARVKTAESFSVAVSRVLAVPYYPVTVETTVTNLPDTTTDESLAAYVSQSLRLILDLSEIDDVDVTIVPSASPTEKDLTFVVTSYTNGTYIFLYDHISSSPTFLPQLEGSVNVFGSFTENTIWQSTMTIENVDLKTTVALATVDVSDETYTALDIDETISDYEANLLTIDPPGTLVEYTIHSETKTPSVSPTAMPSVQPSKTPSVSPTVKPSNFPSTMPSTAPICGPDDNTFLGDPSIQLSDELSQYASGNFEMTVVFPFKFTAYQLRFLGDASAGAYDYDQGDAEDPWVSSDAKCLKQMTVTIPWSAIQDGSVGITWNGATNTFDGVLDLHLKETITKEGSQTLGDTFERDVEYEMPFSILMHTSIVAEADISITISDPTLTSKVLNGLQVVVPDGENPSVTVLFCTEMPYPWVLEVPSPSTDFAMTGTDVIPFAGTLVEISQENCNTFGSTCTQCWQSQWEVSQVCKESGDYSITIPAQYLQVPPYSEEVNVNIDMRLALMPSCEVTVATVEPTGSLVMYPDATFSTSAIVFYIDSEAYGRISVDALQDIDSLTLDSLLVKQDGVSQSLQTSAFEYEEVARTTGDVATIDFKCRFTLSELSGEVSGKPTVITAELSIVYVDGSRRRLQVSTGENDVPTEAKAESTIVLLEGPCSLPYGRLDEIRYDTCTASSKQQIMHCLSSGWSVLSECPTQSVQAESMTTENNDELPWKYFTIILGVIIGLGFVLYWSFTSYCSSGKGEYSFTSAPQIAGEKI